MNYKSLIIMSLAHNPPIFILSDVFDKIKTCDSKCTIFSYKTYNNFR
jgi:hypothetical protein